MEKRTRVVGWSIAACAIVTAVSLVELRKTSAPVLSPVSTDTSDDRDRDELRREVTSVTTSTVSAVKLAADDARIAPLPLMTNTETASPVEQVETSAASVDTARRKFSALARSGSAASLAVTPRLLRSRFSVNPEMQIWTITRDATGKKQWTAIRPSAVTLSETVTLVCEGNGRWVTQTERLRNVPLSSLAVICTVDPNGMSARVFRADGKTVYQIQDWTPIEWTTDPESVRLP